MYLYLVSSRLAMVLFFIFKQNIKLMHFIAKICIFLIFKKIFLYEYSLKKYEMAILLF